MAKNSPNTKAFQPQTEEQRDSPISDLIIKIQQMSEEEKRGINIPNNAIEYLTKIRDDPVMACKINRGYAYAQRINSDRNTRQKAPIDSDVFVLGYLFSAKTDPIN